MSKVNQVLFSILLASMVSCQQGSSQSDFNLDLERQPASGSLPGGWFAWGSDFKLTIDTVVKHSGRQSVRIEPSGTYHQGTFGCLATSFPAVYKGSQIELRAWMKMEDVSEGPIGLLLRIDGQSATLGFDNMQRKNITGTSDWVLYSVKLPNHPSAVKINIGGMLSGSGKLWVDDFEVLIDDVPLDKAEKNPVKIFEADTDHEFDNGSGISIPEPDRLMMTNDSVTHITVGRDKGDLNLTSATIPSGSVPSYPVRKDPAFSMITPDIGYLYLGSVRNADLKSIIQQLEGTRGLVIDLRCYPSEFVVFSLGSCLVEKTTPFVKFTAGSVMTPGLFTAGTTLSVPVNTRMRYKGRTVILVNESTISQAEYTTMALRVAPGAVVVGSQTAGADGNVSPFTLPGGIKTLITGIGVYYPDGGETQRTGIVPDVEVRPTAAGIRQERDEVLEKAIAIINGEVTVAAH